MRCHSGQYDKMVNLLGKTFTLIEERNSSMFLFFFFLICLWMKPCREIILGAPNARNMGS